MSKIGIKQTNNKRFSKSDFKEYENHILEIGECQLCGSYDLDKPHHAKFGNFGADKDDKSLINICVKCHRLIHFGDPYDEEISSEKLREEAVKIGLGNWKIAPSWLRNKYGE